MCHLAARFTHSALCRGFTPYLRDDYLEWKREGRLVNDGVNAKAGCWGCLFGSGFISQVSLSGL